MVFIKRIDNPSGDTGDSTHVGTDHWDWLDKYHDNIDISSFTGKAAKINTATEFRDQVLKILNSGSTAAYTIKAGTISSNQDLTLPSLSGAGTLVAAGGSNDWGDAAQTFRSTYFIMRNPANSNSYIFTTSAIAGNRVVTLPLLTADDEVVMKAFPQTLTSKTCNIDQNTFKHSTTNAQGDIFKYDSTAGKYIRLARGSANQVLRVNSAGTDLEFAAESGSVSADKTKIYEGGTQVGSTARKLNFNDTDFNIAEEAGSDRFTVSLAVAGGGGSSADEMYSNMVPNGNKYGYWNGMSNLGGYGLLGYITGFDVTPTTYIDTTNGYTGSTWSISGTNAVGWKTADAVTMRKLNPDVTFSFLLDEAGDNTGSRFYAGFASTGNVTKSSSFLDSLSGFLMFKHSSENFFKIANNDGSGNMVEGSSILSTNSGIHTIRLLADEANTRFGWSLDGGAITYVSSDIPSSTAQLHVVFNASDDDSTTRNLRGFYAKMKMKERA